MTTPRLLTELSVRRYCPHDPTEQQQSALVAHRFLAPPVPRVSEVFYGGAAGGGKSDWLLMGALEYVDVTGYAAIIFRRTYTDLSLPGAIMARSKEWLTPPRTDAVWNETRKEWRFPSGASITFAFLKNPGDELRYQGAEFQFVGFDELTQFEEEQYTYLFSRCRRPKLDDSLPEALRAQIEALQHVPLRVRAASNPGGIGHGWVKERFPIDGEARGRRVFIPAKIADNPHLDADAYRESLSHLGETLRKQLEEGDWEVAEGMAFYVGEVHRVDRFELRDSFNRFEALDYGLNGAPWCLWAVDYEGNLVAVEMLYERDMLPSDICPLVIERRKGGWGFGHVAHADPSIWHRTGARDKWGAPVMLADEFASNGVPVLPANNDPRAGLIRLRELLELDEQHPFPSWHPRAGELGAPRLFFARGECDALVKELQSAPLQPFDKRDGGEIVMPDWESRHGHACAMARYAVMTTPAASEQPAPGPIEDPVEAEAWLRAEALKKWIERSEDPDYYTSPTATV